MPAVPLGLRSSNPGNIRVAVRPQDRWQGISGEPGNLGTFDTMANGLRALGKQLLVYVEGQRKARPCIGYQVEPSGAWVGIIPIWAPESENATGTYCRYVADVCEVDPADLLNLRDPDTMFWLMTAIGEFENGRKAFHAAVSDADIEAGMRAALA